MKYLLFFKHIFPLVTVFVFFNSMTFILSINGLSMPFFFTIYGRGVEGRKLSDSPVIQITADVRMQVKTILSRQSQHLLYSDSFLHCCVASVITVWPYFWIYFCSSIFCFYLYYVKFSNWSTVKWLKVLCTYMAYIYLELVPNYLNFTLHFSKPVMCLMKILIIIFYVWL